MGTELMAPRKKINRNPQAEAIAQTIINEYQPKTAEDMQMAFKDIFGPIFEALLQGEMDNHLGYESNDHSYKETDNRRNGYTDKTLKTSFGDVPIRAPRDRAGSFQPQTVPKRTTDVSSIEDKVLSMYARGMSQRDISDTIEDIYGFSISAEQISTITDRIMDEVNDWQNRPLKSMYAFMFVDCIYVDIRREAETKNCAVYVILGYDLEGKKDILGFWIGESEGKHYWMQIFDEIKGRGVEDVLFISMDGVSGLEDGARSIFKDVVVQRCIVHMIRNSIKYVPTKDYKKFTTQLKKIYGASSLKAAEAEFEKFKREWAAYKGAIDVWENNWKHVEQLFNYGSAVRKIMYTTNAIEAVNSSLRKVTKKGTFSGDNSVLKAFFLRQKELKRKWNDRPVANWSMVRNQLAMDDSMQARILKHETN